MIINFLVLFIGLELLDRGLQPRSGVGEYPAKLMWLSKLMSARFYIMQPDNIYISYK